MYDPEYIIQMPGNYMYPLAYAWWHEQNSGIVESLSSKSEWRTLMMNIYNQIDLIIKQNTADRAAKGR